MEPLSFYRVHGAPIFTTPKNSIADSNEIKIKIKRITKLKNVKNQSNLS